MQDEYVGDIGDYGKYALLRWLCTGGKANGPRRLRLGVVWYRTNHRDVDPEETKDGRHLEYLEKPDHATVFQQMCPAIWSDLRRIALRADGSRSTVADGRTVWAVMQSSIFDCGTVFYDHAISFADIARNSTAERSRRREQWLRKALAATTGADFVFLDPDNGFQTGKGRTSRQGPKFCFYDELRHFLHRGQSVVVYQHYARGATVQDRAARRFEEIKENCGIDAVALGFSAWQYRYFYMLPVGSTGQCLCRRAEQFATKNALARRWTVHRPNT